jgi:uncharacterized membrane protein YfcA
MTFIIKFCVVAISLYVMGRFVLLLWNERMKSEALSVLTKVRLAVAGFVANVADTVGIGSFAVIVAFDKFWNMVDDQDLPGTLNVQSILPTVCQALFFLQVVQVEVQTLVALIVGASIGGFLGGMFVSKLDKQRIRRFMFIGYIGIALMILAAKLNLLPVGGELMALHGVWLTAGVVGMLVAGALPAIGVGAYAPTQVILFLLGMSPLAAFPIMTAAGAIQQSVAALTFIIRRHVALMPSFIMGLAGVAGVLVAAPIVTYINSESLRWLLLAVVLYNIYMLWKSSVTKPQAVVAGSA